MEIEDAADVERMVTILMGDKVAPRKEYISQYANFNKLDAYEDKGFAAMQHASGEE